MNVLFRRNPAFVYDVCNVYVAKSNPHYTWMNPYLRNKGEDEDRSYIENLFNKFKGIELKTMLLGYKKEGSPALISTMFLDFLKDKSDQISLELFIDFLTDVEVLKKYVSRQYFEVEYIDDASFIQNIHSSTVDNSMRAELYDLALYSDQYVESLKQTVQAIGSVMHDIYSDKENVNKILHANETFNIEEIYKSQKIRKKFFTNLKYKTCFVSFSIFSQYLLLREIDSDGNGWLILGINFSALFEEQDNFITNLHLFGDAIGDPLRVKILSLILENGEMTLADIARKMGIVNTIVIYHIDILKKSNLLRHRYEGRKVLYWINKSQFNIACDEIKKIFGGVE